MQGAGGVDVESLHDGDGLVGAGLAWVDQAQRRLAGAVAEEREPSCRGRAAHLPGRRLVLVVLPLASLEQAPHTLRGPPSNVRNLGGGRRRERLERELSVLSADVHAVEGERVCVRVEAQGRVEALDEPEWTESSSLDGVRGGRRAPRSGAQSR